MEWAELNKKKWELKYNGVVIATIFKRTSAMWAVYIAVPLIFEKVGKALGRTYTFPTFKEAQKQCDQMLLDRAMPWVSAVTGYLTEKGLYNKTGE